ncbi:MAG TPA: hypothetical protein VMW16_15925 [Sedimentisphaerales bacterium]|nr:hypothetical protein [Sedimentisphaerales bacterium]
MTSTYTNLEGAGNSPPLLRLRPRLFVEYALMLCVLDFWLTLQVVKNAAVMPAALTMAGLYRLGRVCYKVAYPHL